METKDTKIYELINKMTIEEKVSQLTNSAAAIGRLKINKYDWWNEALHGVARSGLATVFPEPIGMAASFDEKALHEVFVAVSDEARAKRRTLELQGKGIDAKYEDVLSEMNERDSNDRNRATAPAVPAQDAIMFDNSEIDLEGSISYVIELVRKKCGDKL